MRITDSMLSTNFNVNLSQTTKRLYEAETQVLTEKRLNKPSDDPVDTITALTIRSKLSDIEQYQENISQAQTTLSNTETAVTDLIDIISQVNTIVVEGASDTYSDADKASLAYEVDQLLEEVLNLANNSVDSVYTFGGTNTGTAPYEAARDDSGEITAVTTTGSSGSITAQIGDNVSITVNVNGEDVFDGDVNVFDLLIKVRDDLRSGDNDALQDDLVQLSSASDQVAGVQALVGARVNRVDAAESRAESDYTSFSEYLSDTEDIDASEAIINYQTELLAMQVSLQVGAKILMTSLADFLT